MQYTTQQSVTYVRDSGLPVPKRVSSGFFVFEVHVEFGRIVDDEDDICSFDKPLNNIIEWIRAVDLPAQFQDVFHCFSKSRNRRNLTLSALKIGLRENSYLFEELARQSVNERLAKFLEDFLQRKSSRQ